MSYKYSKTLRLDLALKTILKISNSIFLKQLSFSIEKSGMFLLTKGNEIHSSLIRKSASIFGCNGVAKKGNII